ncbi:P-type conjugative transfer protein TrbL [Luteibacter aegosomatis]|uniref:P-type conjugative transfer protein TrbL n=1 Tax=Luteibacter aegosomatis TaxID=2911537 RepID=UPI001FF8B711|nr:P-type conjugative transfer protein TrbL [Luteibacter aegosomatis]UPG85917.1 P-type conjugative transfer protein TrbL [Luteibacter aegosomatis]
MLRVTTVLFLCAFAGDASAGVAADDLVEGIGKLFREHPNAGFILEAAERLFWTLATISLVWTMGMQILRQDIGEVLMELTRFVVVTGIFFWILDTASRGKGDDGSILNIVNSFFEMSNGSPDATAFIDDANSIARVGLQVYTDVIYATGSAPDADKIILNLLGIGTMIVLCLMAAQFLLLLVAAWMMGYAGIFLLGFGGARWTSPVAIHFYKHVFAIGMCMLVLGFIGHQGYPLLDELANASAATRSGISGYTNQGLMLCVSVLFLVLSLKVPQILYSVVTGSQVGIYVGSASMVGSAIGAGGAAALASMNTWSSPVDQTSRHVDSPSRVSVRADSVMEAVHRSAIGIDGPSEPFNTRVSNYGTTVGDRQANQIAGNATFDRGPSFGASLGASTSSGEPMRLAGDASSRFSHEPYAEAKRLSSPMSETEPGPDYAAEMSAIMESRQTHGSLDSAHPSGGGHMATSGGNTLPGAGSAHAVRVADDGERVILPGEFLDVEGAQGDARVGSQTAISLGPQASSGAVNHADADLRTHGHLEAGAPEVPELSIAADGTTLDRREVSQTRMHDVSVKASVEASREDSSVRALEGARAHETSAVVTERGAPVDVVPGRVGPTSAQAGEASSGVRSSEHVGGSSVGDASTHGSLTHSHVFDQDREAAGFAGLPSDDSVGIAQAERAGNTPAHASSRGVGGLPDGVTDGVAPSVQRASGTPVDASNHGADMTSSGSTTPFPSMSSDGSPEKISVPDASVDDVGRTRTRGAVEVPVPGSIPERAEVSSVEANGMHGTPTQDFGAASDSEPGGLFAMKASVGHSFAGIDEKEGTPARAIVEPVRQDDGAETTGSVADEMPKGVDEHTSLEVVNRGSARGSDARHGSSATSSALSTTIDSALTGPADIANVEIGQLSRDASIDEKEGTPAHAIVESVRHDDGAETIGSVADEMSKGVDEHTSLEVVNRGSARSSDARHGSNATSSALSATIDSALTGSADIANVEIGQLSRDASTSSLIEKIENDQDTTRRETLLGAADVDAPDVESCTTAQDRIRASTYGTADKPSTASHVHQHSSDASTEDPRVTNVPANRDWKRHDEPDPGDPPMLSDDPDADPPT